MLGKLNSAHVHQVTKVYLVKIVLQVTTRVTKDCTWDFANSVTAMDIQMSATRKLEFAETAAATLMVTIANFACQDSSEMQLQEDACHKTSNVNAVSVAHQEHHLATFVAELATVNQTLLEFVVMNVAKELSDFPKPTNLDAANASAQELPDPVPLGTITAMKFLSLLLTTYIVSL